MLPQLPSPGNRVDPIPATNDPGRAISAIAIDPANGHHAWISYNGYNINTPATPGHVFEVIVILRRARRPVQIAQKFAVSRGSDIQGGFVLSAPECMLLGLAMVIDIAVVPVAGLGTRLLPATKSQPKEMLPVGRKPVVQYVVEELTRVGMKRVLFVTGPGKASIENHFDLNGELIQMLRESGKEELLEELGFERSSVQYFYTRQRRLLGLGHAVLCAQSFVGAQPFVVALGDSIIGMHAESDVVQRMMDLYHERTASAVIAFEQVRPDEVGQYGIARPKSGGEIFEIEDLIEKPAPPEAPSDLAIAARYVLSPVIFDALARTRRGRGGEIQLTDAIRAVIRDGGRAFGVRLRPGERRYDIGNFEAYFEAFVEFALSDPKLGAGLRRRLLDVLDVSRP